MIRAILWDYGGVLMRTEDQSPRRQLAERLGIETQTLYDLVFNSPSARQAALGEIQAGQHWAEVCAQARRPLAESEAIQAAFWSGDRLDLDLVKTIRALRPRYRTALLSNAFSDLRQSLGERYAILDAFDEIIISAEVGLTKPDARIYALAVERLGVTPQEAVFVDDFSENIEAARRAGLRTVHFKSARQAIADLNLMLKE